MTTNARATARRGSMVSPVAVVALVLAVVVAFFIYRPDRELPFHHLDFSEFLPVLQSSESFGERTWKLLEYYAQFGRANVVSYALMSAKWELFGWWSPGWQWSRFVVMVGILILAFQLLRRLGASSLGAVAGASVFLAAPAATLGWVILSMGEPVGTLMLLALCLTIMPARRLRESRWRWVVAGLLAAGIVLSKEMLAGTLALPLGLSLVTDEDGRVTAPKLSRHAKQLLLLFSVVGVLCLGPLLIVALAAPGDGYYMRFGDGVRPVTKTVRIWLATFAPLDPANGLPGPAMRVTLAFFVALIAGGWWRYLRIVRPAARQVWLLVLGLLFPLVGSIIYAPWPAYLGFYPIPYLVGTSVLVAFALTGLESKSARQVQIAVYACWCGLLAIAGANAQWLAESTAASQVANYRLLTRVSSLPAIDSVLVATPNVPRYEWEGAASTLSRHATALNIPWPPSRDIPCPTYTPPGAAVPGSVVVYKDWLCSSPANAEQIVERFRSVSLRRLALRDDSVSIYIEIASPGR